MTEVLENGLKTLCDIELLLYKYEERYNASPNRNIIDEVEKHIEYFNVKSIDLSKIDTSSFPIYASALLEMLLDNDLTHIKTYKLKEGIHVLDLPIDLLLSVIESAYGDSDEREALKEAIEDLAEKHKMVKELEKENESLKRNVEDMVRIIAELRAFIKSDDHPDANTQVIQSPIM